MGLTFATRKALSRLGMTSLEMQVYVALLELEATAKDLSSRVGISYSKIYDILGSLERKGWVSSDSARPAMYFPKAPETGLDAIKQQMDVEFVQDKRTILSDLGPLYEKSGASEKPDALVLSGAATIMKKIWSMAESCKRQVMISIPDAGHDLVRGALPRLRALHDRGISITVLTSDRLDPELVKSLSRVSTVRIKQNLFGGGIIVDERYVLMLLAPEVVGVEASGLMAIWADHAKLAGFASEYFEYLLKDTREP